MVLVINCNGNPFDLIAIDVWRGGGMLMKGKGQWQQAETDMAYPVGTLCSLP